MPCVQVEAIEKSAVFKQMDSEDKRKRLLELLGDSQPPRALNAEKTNISTEQVIRAIMSSSLPASDYSS